MSPHPLSSPEDPNLRRRKIEAEVGAFSPTWCEEITKTTGNQCKNIALKYCDRPVCANHATEKELELNRLKHGTAKALLQDETIFGGF